MEILYEWGLRAWAMESEKIKTLNLASLLTISVTLDKLLSSCETTDKLLNFQMYLVISFL